MTPTSHHWRFFHASIIQPTGAPERDAGSLVLRVNRGVTMKRLEFTCEGCDLTRYVKLPPGGKSDVTLDGWVAHHVVMQENGSVIFENSADL
ncbi:MAG TPA: hypothetical protein VIF37_12245, partial [Methylobacter sp.]